MRPADGETDPRGRRRLADLGQATSPAPVVRGRDAELASIGVQLDRVRSGAGAVVLVEGEAGMGKSRLLAEAVRVARRLAFRVGLFMTCVGPRFVTSNVRASRAQSP